MAVHASSNASMRHDLQHGHLLFENLMTQQKSQIDSANLGVRRKIPGKFNNPAVPLEKYSRDLLGSPREKLRVSSSSVPVDLHVDQDLATNVDSILSSGMYMYPNRIYNVDLYGKFIRISLFVGIPTSEKIPVDLSQLAVVLSLFCSLHLFLSASLRHISISSVRSNFPDRWKSSKD